VGRPGVIQREKGGGNERANNTASSFTSLREWDNPAIEEETHCGRGSEGSQSIREGGKLRELGGREMRNKEFPPG